MFANLSAVMGNIKAGTLRALAVTSATALAIGARHSHCRRVGTAGV